MNIEYEYSFKVIALEPFIKLIEEDGFTKTEENFQKRILYKKEDKTMARITIKGRNNNCNVYLDFKDDIESDKLVKERRESLPLKVDNMKAALSIIEFLDYKENKSLKRTRYVYKKDDVEFEIDEYIHPEKMFVVAIEGNKESVDKMYNKIYEKLKEYFLKENK